MLVLTWSRLLAAGSSIRHDRGKWVRMHVQYSTYEGVERLLFLGSGNSNSL